MHCYWTYMCVYVWVCVCMTDHTQVRRQSGDGSGSRRPLVQCWRSSKLYSLFLQSNRTQCGCKLDPQREWSLALSQKLSAGEINEHQFHFHTLTQIVKQERNKSCQSFIIYCGCVQQANTQIHQSWTGSNKHRGVKGEG